MMIRLGKIIERNYTALSDMKTSYDKTHSNQTALASINLDGMVSFFS